MQRAVYCYELPCGVEWVQVEVHRCKVPLSNLLLPTEDETFEERYLTARTSGHGPPSHDTSGEEIM